MQDNFCDENYFIIFAPFGCFCIYSFVSDIQLITAYCQVEILEFIIFCRLNTRKSSCQYFAVFCKINLINGQYLFPGKSFRNQVLGGINCVRF